MNPDGSYASNLIRGRTLREQTRYREAESFLGRAIQDRPDQPEPYYELGFCFCNTNRAEKALQALDQALRLSPTDPSILALRAWVLVNLKQHKSALAASDLSLAVHPFNLLAVNARTRAYIHLCQWDQALESALRGVSLDPHGTLTVNLLTCVYRMTGRNAEVESLLTGLLGEKPNDPTAHTHIGWMALEDNDPKKAQFHFREALRFDPHNEGARLGLLQSLHARIWFYRWYFRLTSLAARSYARRLLVFGSLYLIYFVATYGGDFNRPAGWTWFCATFYVSFVLAKSLGDFFLIFDRQMRHCLSRRERWMGFMAAGLLTFFFAGLVTTGSPVLISVSLVIPISYLAALLMNQRAQRDAEPSKGSNADSA